MKSVELPQWKRACVCKEDRKKTKKSDTCAGPTISQTAWKWLPRRHSHSLPFWSHDQSERAKCKSFCLLTFRTADFWIFFLFYPFFFSKNLNNFGGLNSSNLKSSMWFHHGVAAFSWLTSRYKLISPFSSRAVAFFFFSFFQESSIKYDWTLIYSCVQNKILIRWHDCGEYKP